METLLSVTEYANLHGKDPGNVRRHLLLGRIKGYKIGKQWAIPEDAKYPDDLRESNGQYKNWRKKMRLKSNKELMKTINSLIDDLTSIYGKSLHSIVLYGSYARGSQTEESDVDIVLILDSNPQKKQTNKMIDSVIKHEHECGKVLSIIETEEKKYTELKDILPFYKNIEKEGIVLWTAA